MERRVEATLELVGLADKADRRVKGFSGGELQRVGIGQAQVHYPDLLILDEPAASLDPQGRRDVLEVMERLREYATVFYCTHILDDVQKVSDTVAILNHGELVAHGPIQELLSGGHGTVYTVTMNGDVARAHARVSRQPWVLGVEVHQQVHHGAEATTWHVQVTDAQSAKARCLPPWRSHFQAGSQARHITAIPLNWKDPLILFDVRYPLRRFWYNYPIGTQAPISLEANMNTQPTDKQLLDAYALAKERYGLLGVDTDAALENLTKIPISLHCWQGDDVGGFEAPDAELGGGLAVTGSHPGKARNAHELRRDLDKAYGLIPGTHRLNLHAIYAETGGVKVERNELQPQHFAGWVDWARENNHGLDFNPTFFAHPKAASGFTLASYDAGARQFWIEHGIACRKIGAYFGRELGTPCVTNIWIPDGFKDVPADRKTPRRLLKESLDTIIAEKINPQHNLDAVEGKLFGLGSESYVVGSHEFYLSYALSRGVLLCLDAGHFHPTEVISDKLSAVLQFLDEVLLHVSRGVRWDSDHVVTFSDELQAIAQEIVRGDYVDRVHIGLDFFDASINRVAAWVIGTRNTLKALLMALLEPIEELRAMEVGGDFTGRLVLLEELKGMPFGAVWDFCCLGEDVPVGTGFLDEIRAYEQRVLAERT